MNIRRAVKKDINGINNLLLQVLTVHHEGRPDIFKPNCRKYSDEELAELIEDDSKPIFVYEDNGAVLAHAFCVIREFKNCSNLYDMKMLYIDDLCVDKKMRGRHIGTELYNYVKSYAREIGCYNLTLNVWECNREARVFYEGLGLKPQRTTMEEIL